jgi:hypothetical protein
MVGVLQTYDPASVSHEDKKPNNNLWNNKDDEAEGDYI